MIYSFINLYHSFNLFLGTTNGELFKRALELVLFLIVLYMLATEWLNNRKRELKYIMFAFLSLVISRAIMTLMYGFIVFRSTDITLFYPFVPVLNNFLEIFAFILLANAFIYPAFKEKTKYLKGMIATEIFSLIVLSILMEFWWLDKIKLSPAAVFEQQFGYFAFELMKALLLLYPVFVIIISKKSLGKYHKGTIAAFLVYSVAPIINMINYLFYNSGNHNLNVMAHPFPFLAVLLFTRVIFLALVDKATLKMKLSATLKKYEQTEELCKLKDDFISIMSHELRTPLTSMKLYLSLLLEGKMGSINKKQKDSIKIVKQENDRLANLINDILDLSKLESKTTKLGIKKCNLYEITNESMYYALAKEKNIKVINKVPRNFYVNIDIDKFKQVFINLFNNAVKYTLKNGKITLNAWKDDDVWHFSVKDTGIGIPKDKLPKVFDKFYQVEDHLVRKAGGTGLGLAIAKNIVELHHGTINVESIVNKGSKFTVTIPY